MSDIDSRREQWETEHMSCFSTEKTWHIPAFGDIGPVTITLRLPEVRVVDSEGQQIVISPHQADLVASKLGSVVDWMHTDELED